MFLLLLPIKKPNEHLARCAEFRLICRVNRNECVIWMSWKIPRFVSDGSVSLVGAGDSHGGNHPEGGALDLQLN